MSNSPEVSLTLHDKQAKALQSEATEILYGGAAGGGKSHLMRVAAILWCSSIDGLQVYLFRRIRDDLVKNHIEGPKGLRAMLAPWVAGGFVDLVGEEIRFWNGSKIYLCHCKDEKDRFKYLGAEIHVLLIDELTTFTETIYRFLRGRCRAVGLKPGEEWGAFPKIVSSSNPGNIGHQWVKGAFVDGGEWNLRDMPDDEGGMRRVFIPARLDDNPSMASDDPSYRSRLRGLGSKELVRAMEEGDWNVIEGAYFDCWSNELIVRPFSIPEHWLRFRSFDWGSAKPFSVGWWAVASEDVVKPEGLIPKGALIRYREWYGAKTDSSGATIPDTGLKLTAEELAKGILTREAGEEITYGVADPSIFTQDGGPSHAERMAPVYWRRADNTRVARRGHIGGWDQLRARMIGDGRPMIFAFSTCSDSIRTIPALQHDPLRPEDLNTGAEDHAADEWRYAVMSRPWTVAAPSDETINPQASAPTFNELREIVARRRTEQQI